MIEVILPAPLRELARISGPIRLAVAQPPTQRSLLDALERDYPMLRGTTRDHSSGKRRAYLRFFACGKDLSNAAPDAPLPEAVATGAEPFVVLGAMSGG
jgi:molybdopterin synthase sulfur carrier subunit